MLGFSSPSPLLDVAGTVTDFSGLVLPVSIGTPAQLIYLGLNFVSAHSLLYSGNACPPFLSSHCFDPDTSASYIESFRMHSPEVVHGQGIELVRIGEVDKPGFGFQIDLNFPYKSLEFRDVGGFLGAGPQSEIFRSKIIELSSDTDGSEFRLREVPEHEIPESETIDVQVVDSAKNWEFVGTLGSTGSVRFIFNPIHDGIVLPDVMKARVRSYRTDGVIDSDGTLLVDCSNRHLVMFIRGSMVLLEMPRRDRGMRNGVIKCESPIKFDSQIMTPVIGRILMRSTRKMFLDYRRTHIVLELGIGSVNRFVATQESPVVLFDYPQFQGQRLVIPRTHNRNGLVLMSLAPRTLFQADVEYQCWTFHRIHESLFPSVDIVGTGSEIAPSFSPDGVSFEVSNMGDTLRLTVFTGTRSTKVCTSANTGGADTVNLPPSQVLDSALEADCSICLDAMVKNERVQGLHHCMHIFHSECIETWLRKATNRNCPVCRRGASGADTEQAEG